MGVSFNRRGPPMLGLSIETIDILCTIVFYVSVVLLGMAILWEIAKS